MGKRGNPNHDPHNGQFTSGGGGSNQQMKGRMSRELARRARTGEQHILQPDGSHGLNIPAGSGARSERHRGGRASQAYKDAREGVAPPKTPRYQPDRTTRHPVPVTHAHYPSGSLMNEHRSGHRRSR